MKNLWVNLLRGLTLVSILAVSGCAAGGGGQQDTAVDSGIDDGSDGGDGTGGGGGDPDPDPDPDPTPEPSPLHIASAEDAFAYLDVIDSLFPPLRDTMNARGLSDYADIHTLGSMQYEGYMNLVFIVTPAANVMGNASFSVDLDSGETFGNADGFVGVVMDDQGNQQYVDYLGDIAISGGSLDASGYDLQIDGTLENGLNAFGVTGQLNGYLFGPNADGLRVVGSKGFFSDDITMTVDGVEIDNGSAGIWATQD